MAVGPTPQARGEVAPVWLGLEIRAGLSDGPADWEVKSDLALLKQLELVETHGHGRGAFWRIVTR